MNIVKVIHRKRNYAFLITECNILKSFNFIWNSEQIQVVITGICQSFQPWVKSQPFWCPQQNADWLQVLTLPLHLHIWAKNSNLYVIISWWEEITIPWKELIVRAGQVEGKLFFNKLICYIITENLPFVTWLVTSMVDLLIPRVMH